MAQKLFQQADVDVVPGRRWMIVRVLPKEQMSTSGRVIMVENQNKLLYEGVVIRVYEPYRTARERIGWHHVEKIEGEMATIGCQVHPNDHVLFPHFEGLPVGNKLDEKKYRFLEEGIVVAKLDYRPRGWLLKKLSKIVGKKSAKNLLENFDIIPKDGIYCRTLSGK